MYTETLRRHGLWSDITKLGALSQSFDLAVRRGDAKEAEKVGGSIKHLLSEVANTQSFDDETMAISIDAIEFGVKISQLPERTDS